MPARTARTFAAALALALAAAQPAQADQNKNLFPCDQEELNRLKNDHAIAPNDVHVRIGYGRCLVVHGHVAEGMAMLHYISENGAIPAAYFIAYHTKSGGTMTATTDRDNLDEAIDDFFYVQALINSDTSYPNNKPYGWRVYEHDIQMELNSLYYVPHLYRYRFQTGSINSENDYIAHSVGSKYPETVWSLNETIKQADYCLSTPHKNHFKPAKYDLSMKACRIFRDEAAALLPLENRRVQILDRRSCSREGLLECAEYKALRDEMVAIIRGANAELNRIFGAYNAIHAN